MALLPGNRELQRKHSPMRIGLVPDVEQSGQFCGPFKCSKFAPTTRFRAWHFGQVSVSPSSKSLASATWAQVKWWINRRDVVRAEPQFEQPIRNVGMD